MNYKRIQAIKYYLMAPAEKQAVLKSLPQAIANKLLDYDVQLSNIIPSHISLEEKKYILAQLFSEKMPEDKKWQQFTETVIDEIAKKDVIPSKLRQALME